MIGVDTSFLVALSVREHPSHGEAIDLFERTMRGRPASMALAPQVLTEFCHVITDPRRFERPLDMSEALELCEQWWNAEECRTVTVEADAGALFLTWMVEFKLGRKRLLDTLLAATYYSAGVVRLVSTDWRDFETYGVFELERL